MRSTVLQQLPNQLSPVLVQQPFQNSVRHLQRLPARQPGRQVGVAKQNPRATTADRKLSMGSNLYFLQPDTDAWVACLALSWSEIEKLPR